MYDNERFNNEPSEGPVPEGMWTWGSISKKALIVPEYFVCAVSYIMLSIGLGFLYISEKISEHRLGQISDKPKKVGKVVDALRANQNNDTSYDGGSGGPQSDIVSEGDLAADSEEVPEEESQQSTDDPHLEDNQTDNNSTEIVESEEATDLAKK